MSNGDLLDTFGNIAKATGGVPLNPLLVAGMQGAANVASDGVKKEAAKEAAAQPTPEVTIHGDGTATIKKLPVTDVLEKGALDAQKPIDDVEALIRERFAKAKAAGLITEADNPYGADLANNVNGFSGGYHASRELGANPIKAAIQGLEVAHGGITPEYAATRVRQQRVAKLNTLYDTEAKPLLAEAQSQRNAANADRRLENADQRETRQQFDDYLKNVDPTGSEEDAVAGLHTRMGATVQPGMEGMVRSTYRTKVRAMTNQAIDRGKAAISSITDQSILPDEDPQKYVAQLPLANNEQRAIALDRVKRVQSRIRQMDQRAQDAHRLEVLRARHEADQLQFGEDMAKLNTPEAINQTVQAVLNDGSQLYNLPEKTAAQQAYKAKVIAGVQAATNGRLPAKLNSEDDKRLTVVMQGKNDLAKVAELYDKWNAVGVPIGGPATAAINDAIIANKPKAYIARIAEKALPGFAKLTPAQQTEYVTDAANAAHRINALTGRETRAVAGGRFSTQLFDVYKGTTPGFQSPDVFKGLVAGAKQEFDNAESAIRQKQWGGEPPSGGGAQKKATHRFNPATGKIEAIQ